jgi:hypothetical protein
MSEKIQGDDVIADFWEWYQHRYARDHAPLARYALDKCEEAYRTQDRNSLGYWHKIYMRERPRVPRPTPSIREQRLVKPARRVQPYTAQPRTQSFGSPVTAFAFRMSTHRYLYQMVLNVCSCGSRAFATLARIQPRAPEQRAREPQLRDPTG